MVKSGSLLPWLYFVLFLNAFWHGGVSNRGRRGEGGPGVWIMEPILRHLNLHLPRQRFRRLARFS
jgi:hypothetical protein